jgi:hypothetical protein
MGLNLLKVDKMQDFRNQGLDREHKSNDLSFLRFSIIHTFHRFSP